MVIELIGISASGLVLLSFLLKGETEIRKMNTVGAAAFVIYGILIHSVAITLMNTILIGVQIYNIRKQKQK